LSQNYITRTELVDTLDEGVCSLIDISQYFDIPQNKLQELQKGKFPKDIKIPMGKYAELWESED